MVATVKAAKAKGMTTIALTGKGGATLGPMVDMLLEVPSTETPQIQRVHIRLYHHLCAELKERIAARGNDSNRSMKFFRRRQRSGVKVGVIPLDLRERSRSSKAVICEFLCFSICYRRFCWLGPQRRGVCVNMVNRVEQ